MKKKVMILTSIIILLLIVGELYVYKNFYEINLAPFNYSFEGIIVDSPNDKYQFRIRICKSDENSSELYIMGTLVEKIYIEKNTTLISDKNSKVIYWDKVYSNSTIDNSIEVNWIDEYTIKIDNKILNVTYDKYDYRRQ